MQNQGYGRLTVKLYADFQLSNSTLELLKVQGSTEHIMEYYLALKKNEILMYATMWMNLEDIMLSEEARHKETNIV